MNRIVFFRFGEINKSLFWREYNWIIIFIAFVALDGVNSMIKVLGVKANFQIQYQLSFCLWVLTFNPTIAEKLNAYGVIPVLSDILADAQKEKVSRIILAVFRVSV